MENKDKAISLFKYIKELYAQRYQVITDVRKQQWYKFVSEIPQDNENIVFNYMDMTDNEEEPELDSAIILRVKKTEFEACPDLPKSLKNWVEDGWQQYASTLVKKEKLERFINGKISEVLFVDDDIRVKEYDEWNRQRDLWVVRQKKIAETRDFFNDLYYLYIDLNRDSETIELMVGQGILECGVNSSATIYHPVLLKRVSMEFDSYSNVLTVLDGTTNPEIYAALLQSIDYINHSAVKTLNEELSENYYHPLDRNDTPDYLKSFAHRLHSESRYEDGSTEGTDLSDKVVIHNNPVLFVRKRTGGILKALDQIIGQIAETGELSGPILNLIGENVSQLAEPNEKLDLSQSLAAVSGEDKDILLSKEANKEQLQIAKRIENYNAVLVQGPPGTGKTHTIANLIGHFLAQGKNILVTSHTKKALAVVKEKVVPELQDLCVSVLDDNNRDMERSVDGITEYISTHTSLELAESKEKLTKQREKILNDLSEVRKKIYAIKYKEYETITFGGKGYSVAEAARFVFENQDKLSYIPGRVKLYYPLPVSKGDLELLYKTNEKISIREESELSYELPNPKDLLFPEEFRLLVNKNNNIIENLKQINSSLKDTAIVDFGNNTAVIHGEPLCGNFNSEKAQLLKNTLSLNSNKKYEEWQLNAVMAGKKYGGFRKVWENLIAAIKDAYEFSDSVAPIIIGNRISTEELITHKTIQVLAEIKEHLNSGKKLSPFILLMHKEWKTLLSTVKINENEISTADDCTILIDLVELNLKRTNIERLWSELIEKHGGIAFEKFGEEPEQPCISFVPEIEEYLNWYNNTFKDIQAAILECGFNPLTIKNPVQYISQTDEINYVIHLIYTIFPKYIDIAKAMYVDLPEVQNKIQNSISVLQSAGLKNSTICHDLILALNEQNVESYQEHYKKLDSLYDKYFYQSERSRILKVISEYAPEWAELIKNRVGMHGKSKAPENIEDAWKWKQFAGIIDEITSQPFEELQHKSVLLNSELRKVTAKLTESSAWYHLLARIESDISKKQALQGWKLTTKKIGKGTGRNAPKLKREAQKLMTKCQSAVPAWIMPVNKALESLDPTKNKFDIVIIDEASQSDISALAVIYLAKKIIIVGDDEQVSPSAVGAEVDKMTNLADMYIKNIIPNSHLYDMKSSVYDIGKTTFPTLMLREHFRCVPSIIGYSNRLSYDYKIKPLRDDSNVPVKPATVAYRVDGVRTWRKQNIAEAKTIVALMLACMEQQEYGGMTFGAISLLGDAQAQLINKYAIEKINPREYEKRRILCGNASHFQGDERDIIFLSLVDNNEGEGPLRIVGEGAGKSVKQRYNVAVSRAKNQLWVVHSLDINNDLKSGDMRKDLIEYATNPDAFTKQIDEIKKKAESPFEISVAKELVKTGYHIVQQWPVGSYRIDMVALYGDRKVAIECDGELYHSGYEKIKEDMERQAVLERLGWRFIRIRGSEYYRNPKNTIDQVIFQLKAYEIEPEQNIEVSITSDTDLKQRVISLAAKIINDWDKEENEII